MKNWLLLIALVLFLMNLNFFLCKHLQHSRAIASQPPIGQPPDPVQPVDPLSPIKLETIPAFIAIPTYRTSEASTVYGDILSHSKGQPFGDASGRSTNAHETTHGINSEIRNANQVSGSRVNGFYVLEGRGVLLKEPRIKMSDAKRFVPESLHSYRWDLYFGQQLASWNDTPTYICDEWVAYVNGGACSVDDVRKGKHRGGWTDGVSGCGDFSFYAIALAMAVKQHDPEYWTSYPQFKSFIIWELRMAQRMFMEGRVMREYKWKKQDDLLLKFLESPDAQAMRQFCREELQGVWVDIDPAAIRATNYDGLPMEQSVISASK